MARRVIRRPERLHHVVQYSGGVGSWATAIRVKERYGTEHLKLLFADTLIEDQDLYRFLIETAANVFDLPRPAELTARALKLPDPTDDPEIEADRRRELLDIAKLTREAIPQLHWITEGRDPWDVFFDRKYLGNTRLDPCSEALKRTFLRDWMEEHHVPRNTTAYIGVDWTEEHRLDKARSRWLPWTVEAPLCEPPLVAKTALLDDLSERGIRQPRLYEMGYPHNNCGGFCIKAGMAHFKHLAQTQPERYAYHERREQEIREFLGKDVAIMRDRTNAARAKNDGKPQPLTMEQLRLRLIEGGEIDEFDWGGCGCAI